MTTRTIGIMTAVIALCGASVLAQDSQPSASAVGTAAAPDGTLTSVVDTWTIEINPRLWWVSPSGDLRLPGSASGTPKVRIEDLNLDTPQFTPAGSVSIDADNFRFSFAGASFSNDAEFFVPSPLAVGSISLLPTDPSESSFDLGIYELNVGYRFYQLDYKRRSEPSIETADLHLDLYALAGARMYDLNIRVSQAGTGVSEADEFYIEPIIGVRSELTIIRDFTINLQLDGGGMGDSDRSSFSFNIAIDFQWRPTPWFGVQIGWRQVAYSFEDGTGASAFEYEGAMAGLFTGAVLRF